MTINERFREIIKYKNISIKDVAISLGKTEAYVRKLLRPGESFGLEPVISILNSFEDISSDWLILGKGNMLKEFMPEEDTRPVTIERLMVIIESQQRTIENLSRK